MSFNERSLTALFSKYRKQHLEEFGESMVIEFKIVKHPKQTLNLKNDFQPHQIYSLIQAQNSCIYFKLSDLTPGFKFADSFNLCNIKSFVGVCFYKPHTPHIIYFIPINLVLACQLRNNKITLQDAKQFAQFSINLSI